jgi:hypothetical protein
MTLAGVVRFLVLPVSESKFYRAPNVLWASKKNVALADRKVRSCLEAVSSRPRADGVEENSVRLDHIRIRKMFDLGEILKGRVDTGRECGMLEAPDDFRVLFLGRLRKYPCVSKSPNGSNVTAWLRADSSPGVAPFQLA